MLNIYIQMGALPMAVMQKPSHRNPEIKEAGYILMMGFTVTIDLSEEDAQKVRKGPKDDDIEAHVYKMAASGVNMEITATRIRCHFFCL